MSAVPGVRLSVCETCVRDRRLAAGEPSQGRQLIDALRRLGPIDGCTLRVVACLRGCLNPANVALRGADKVGLRLSRLRPADAAAIASLAALYVASDDGEVAQALWPAELAGKLSARIPPPGVAR